MKKYIAFVVLALLLGTNAAQAQRRYSVYGIGFYNLENLFDTCHDAGKNDYEYLPCDGIETVVANAENATLSIYHVSAGWTRIRYNRDMTEELL